MSDTDASIVARLLPVALLLLVACGPSQEEIDSGRSMDQAVRQLTSVCQDFVQGISGEGELSRVEMNDYYSGYVNRIQTIKQDLAGQTLVGAYRDRRATFDSVSTQTIKLIRLRKRYISDAVELSDIVEDFRENVSRAEESRFENTYDYLTKAYLKEREFNQEESDLDSLKSNFGEVAERLRGTIEKYNSSVGRGDLVTRDSIRYCTTVDSLPAFVGEARAMLEVVEFDYGEFEDIIEEAKKESGN